MTSILLAGIVMVASWLGQEIATRPPNLATGEVSELQKKAEAGDASAQFALAEAYDFGNGVAQSDKNALLWYRKSADQGFAPAQNSPWLDVSDRQRS